MEHTLWERGAVIWSRASYLGHGKRQKMRMGWLGSVRECGERSSEKKCVPTPAVWLMLSEDGGKIATLGTGYWSAVIFSSHPLAICYCCWMVLCHNEVDSDSEGGRALEVLEITCTGVLMCLLLRAKREDVAMWEFVFVQNMSLMCSCRCDAMR